MKAGFRSRSSASGPGDLGVAPTLLGIVLVALFFYSKDSLFLSAGNLSNLIVQMAGVSAVAMGVVFVLLLGEIDLSIGSVSGVAGVIVAELQLPGSGHQYKGLIAIAAALAAGAVIGSSRARSSRSSGCRRSWSPSRVSCSFRA